MHDDETSVEEMIEQRLVNIEAKLDRVLNPTELSAVQQVMRLRKAYLDLGLPYSLLNLKHIVEALNEAQVVIAQR